MEKICFISPCGCGRCSRGSCLGDLILQLIFLSSAPFSISVCSQCTLARVSCLTWFSHRVAFLSGGLQVLIFGLVDSAGPWIRRCRSVSGPPFWFTISASPRRFQFPPSHRDFPLASLIARSSLHCCSLILAATGQVRLQALLSIFCLPCRSLFPVPACRP
jgi:hypothetical protein